VSSGTQCLAAPARSQGGPAGGFQDRGRVVRPAVTDVTFEHPRTAAYEPPAGRGKPCNGAARTARTEVSDGQEVPGAGIGGRVTELRHRPCLDLTDALAGEVEVLTDLFERPRLAPVESEAEPQDLALALVER
jgi:hypothetical protein